ncbi:PAS domain S-box protein [Thalassolituus sp. LLYu03]|uniref:PAS domain S-box protein n=1 Tax=Thalassolituus sp. LLYu03 TaxID=3421656 RepID=UPI003D2DC06E
MRAADLIHLLSQYDPDIEVPVSFAHSDMDDAPVPQITTCASHERSRCYESLVERAEDGMLVVNAGGHITYMNPYLVRLCGYAPAELAGRPLTELMPRDDADLLRQRLLGRDGRSRFTVRLINRNRDVHWVQISATAIPSSDGTFRGCMMTVTDLSRQQIYLQNMGDQQLLGDKVERIHDQLERLKVLRTHLLGEADDMQDLPRIDATPFWHQGRYLYLIEPQKNGKRKRQYVGSDPDKVKGALAAMRRQQRYQQVQQELTQIEHQIRNATFKLDSFLWDLAQVPPELHRLLPASA